MYVDRSQTMEKEKGKISCSEQNEFQLFILNLCWVSSIEGLGYIQYGVFLFLRETEWCAYKQDATSSLWKKKTHIHPWFPLVLRA